MTREEAIGALKEKLDYYERDKRLKAACETLIPELRESEDERIKNEIIDFIEWAEGFGYIRHDYHQAKRPAVWLNWLEKQKTSEEAIRYVKENHSPDEVSDFQAAMNISVAKAYDKGVQDTLEKQKEQKDYRKLYEDIAKSEWFKKAYEGKSLGSDDEQKEQKPWEWGEEETKILDSIIDDYEKASKSFCGYDGKIGLLRAIRDGEYNLPKQEWSEEDEKIRNEILEYFTITRAQDFVAKPERQKWISYIEKQKEQKPSIFPPGLGEARWNPISSVQQKPAELEQLAKLREMTHEIRDVYERGIEVGRVESKQEWSEEDERIKSCIGLALTDVDEQRFKGFRTTLKDCLNWLKSLRPSCKPSEEQMKALEECGECKQCIKKLYEDLQKRCQ